jgi:hypothetical protein
MVPLRGQDRESARKLTGIDGPPLIPERLYVVPYDLDGKVSRFLSYDIAEHGQNRSPTVVSNSGPLSADINARPNGHRVTSECDQCPATAHVPDRSEYIDISLMRGRCDLGIETNLMPGAFSPVLNITQNTQDPRALKHVRR